MKSMAVRVRHETPVALGPNDGIRYDLGGGVRWILKASSEDTDGKFSVFEWHRRGAGGTSLHVHARADEGIYVLAGACEIACGGSVVMAVRGSFVLLPRGVAHQVRWKRGGRAIVIASRGGFQNYFAAEAKLVSSGQLTWNHMRKLGRRWGSSTFVLRTRP